MARPVVATYLPAVPPHFDASRRSGGIMAGTLDHIGVERSLCQKRNWTASCLQPPGFLLKSSHKLFPDELTFLLRIDHTSQAYQETLTCINNDQRNMQMLFECLYYLLAFTCTQQARIHKNTGKLFTYRFMNQQSGYRRVHSTGNTADHALLSHALSYQFCRFLYRGAGCPGRFTTAYAEEKVAYNLFALWCMRHLGMKL